MADSSRLSPREKRRGPDLATLVGIGGALLLIAAALFLGGSPGAFLNLEAFLIVGGGTAAVTLASFTVRDLAGAFSQLGSSLAAPPQEPQAAALRVLSLADYARKRGVLRLQGAILADVRKTDPFLFKALNLVVDGLSEVDLDMVLRQELHTRREKLERAISVLRRAAEVAPAMGLIGTMIGLVQMLGRLTEPSMIGPGMAVALLTTFYGAILGNVVLLPLAGKLERSGTEEDLIMRIHAAAAVSIARKENPRRLEMQLNALLPGGSQVHVYD